MGQSVALVPVVPPPGGCGSGMPVAAWSRWTLPILMGLATPTHSICMTVAGR